MKRPRDVESENALNSTALARRVRFAPEIVEASRQAAIASRARYAAARTNAAPSNEHTVLTPPPPAPVDMPFVRPMPKLADSPPDLAPSPFSSLADTPFPDEPSAAFPRAVETHVSPFLSQPIFEKSDLPQAGSSSNEPHGLHRTKSIRALTTEHYGGIVPSTTQSDAVLLARANTSDFLDFYDKDFTLARPRYFLADLKLKNKLPLMP